MGRLPRLLSALLGVAALFGPGCQRSELSISIPYVDTDHAALVAISSGAALELYAVDPSDHNPRTFYNSDALGADDSLSITALFYRRPLGELGLTPGSLTPVDDGSGRPIPAPDEILAMNVSGSDDGAWAPLAQLPLELDRLRVPRAQSCLQFRGDTQIELGLYPDRVIAGLVPYDETSALLIVNGSSVFESEISRVSAAGLAPIDLGIGPFRATGVVRSDDGRIWIIGGTTSQAELWVGNSDTPFVRKSSDNSIVSQYRFPSWLTVAGEGEPADTVYALNQAGELYKIHDQTWARVANESVLSRRMIWIGPELVVTGDRDDLQIHAYDHGAVRIEPLPIDDLILGSSDESRGLARLPGIGVFAGSFNGRVMLREQNGWSVIVVDRQMNSMNVFATIANRVVVGGSFGMLAQLDPEAGLCEPVFLGGSNIWQIAPIADGAIVSGQREVDTEHDQLFVQRVELVP